MTERTDIQMIMQDGHPVFVVIPYSEYVRLFPQSTPRIPPDDAVPHEVVAMTIKQEVSLARAWREYLGLTQQEVAIRMGISQAALAQMESAQRPRRATSKKLAAALGVSVEQLM